jgi:hypothetical protein
MSPSIPAATHQVRLHFKVLEPPPKMNPAAMADYMRDVYAPHGIDVVVAPAVENLDLEALKDLWVDDCMLGSPTEDQEKLFAHRDGVPANEICVYFIRSTVDDEAAGCASRATAPGFPNGRPAVVVTKDATAWTLGHECGHVLGLSHVAPITRVMVSGTWKITVDPPALDPAEVATIKKSPFTKLVAPGVLPPASGSPAESDEDGADAIRSKGDDGDRLARVIRTELDQDDGVDYDGLARKFGPSAVEALATVVCESRARIAAGAVALAARLDGGGGFPVVAQGAANKDAVVRVAAAASARRLPGELATPIVERLLEDRDVGVRGHAVRSAVRIGTPDLLERVRAKAREDPSPAIRELAAGLLDPPTGSAS